MGYGGRGGIFFNSKAVCRKVDMKVETVNSRFFCYTSVIVETQELFPKIHLTQKRVYAYLSLLMGTWNMQDHWDSDLFWFGDSRMCVGFVLLCVVTPRNQTCHLFNCTQELHLLRHIFWAHQKSGNFGFQKVVRFSWNPSSQLSHPMNWDGKETPKRPVRHPLNTLLTLASNSRAIELIHSSTQQSRKKRIFEEKIRMDRRWKRLVRGGSAKPRRASPLTCDKRREFPWFPEWMKINFSNPYIFGIPNISCQ